MTKIGRIDSISPKLARVLEGKPVLSDIVYVLGVFVARQLFVTADATLLKWQSGPESKLDISTYADGMLYYPETALIPYIHILLCLLADFTIIAKFVGRPTGS